MQSLDVISINIWQIVVSLINLVLLFLIVKRFLYKPVKKMLENRQNEVEKRYSDAEKANNEALENKKNYEEKLSAASVEADGIIQSAVDTAKAREKEIVSDAKLKAEGIILKAENDAKLAMLKAEDSIKQEIIDVSTVLAEKMLKREISEQDHKDLIDSFIDNIGDGDE
ncbi:MAG: F0F1 ATP synthase subunit B [Clostridia bacterium]|nr:F0F1 ATP synthase subunit B [Clostridia bacterium]